MSLDDLKNFWKDICLDEKDVKTFNVGSNYDIANNTDDKYPLCFYEMPYTITYSADWQKGADIVTFALSVLLWTKQDDIEDSHQAISFAKTIGDAIITKVQLEKKDFRIQSVNALSVREFSDDYVAGMRYDITIILPRDVCDGEIQNYFN